MAGLFLSIPTAVHMAVYFFHLTYLQQKTKKEVICNEKGHWEGSQLSLVDFLKGNVTIYKKPIPTEIEQIAINYALAYGCHWIAKDSDGVIYAYKRKPHKSSYSDMWDDDVNDDKLMVEIKLPISFLSWEDEAPYYIG